MIEASLHDDKHAMVQPTLSRPARRNSISTTTHLPRSRACITCRRRKVKCDEGKPQCQRCVAHGCDCEGYESQPARAIKTQQALLKRWKPKQEAASGRQKNSLSGQQHVFAVSISADDLATDKAAALVARNTVDAAMPAAVNSPAVVESQYFGLFLDGYMPSDAEGPAKWYNPWLCHVLDTQDAQLTPTLNASIRAVALTRVGRAHSDDALLAEGKKLYVKALCMLQQSLLTERKTLTETTLLVARTLALYELFEHTDPFAWIRHQEGLEMLVQARGWEEFHSSQKCKALLGFKDTVMFRAFCRRRKPFLTSEPWKTEPLHDPSSIDDFHQMIIDIGLFLADVLADSNLSIDQLDQGILSLEHVEMCFENLEECDRRLNKWIEDYRAWIRLPLYTTVFSGDGDDMHVYTDKSAEESYEERLEYRFPTFKHAIAVLYYWAMQVCLDMLFEELVDLTGVPWTPSSPDTLDIDERLERRLDLCAHLLRTVAPLMRLGAIGPTRCLFGWDAAMGALQKEQRGAMAEALLHRGREIHVQYMTRARMDIVGRGQFRRGASESPGFDSQVRQRVILTGKGEHHQPLYMDFGMAEVGDEVVVSAVADGCRA